MILCRPLKINRDLEPVPKCPDAKGRQGQQPRWVLSCALLIVLLSMLLVDRAFAVPEVAVSTFHVEVAPEFASVADFPVRLRFALEDPDPARFMLFVMPAELLGSTWGFSLRETKILPDGRTFWSGKNASATCTEDALKSVCEVVFDNLAVAFKDVDVYLRAVYSDPEELEKRRFVAKEFLDQYRGRLEMEFKTILKSR